MGMKCCVLNRVWLICMLFIWMSHQGIGQINYSLNCVGGFSCNNESDGSVAVILTETQRLLHIESVSNYDFIYAQALFGPDIYVTALSGELKYFSNPDLGCSAYPAGTFTGKVAVIDRGTCSFESKVLNAQNAGAVGVVIVNNVAGAPFALGGNNLGVTIPSVMISQSDGIVLKNLLAQPAIATGTTPQYTYQWSCGSTMPTVSGLKEGTYTVTVLADNDDTLSCTTQVLANNRSANIVTNSSIINCPFDSLNLSVSNFNNAISMNGTNQWINLNTNVTNLNNASFTMEAWINSSSGSEGIIVSSNSNNVWEAGERAFFIDDIGRITFSGFDNGSMTSSVEVDDGIWHHVAVVWDYSIPPGVGKIYIDGFDRTVSMNYAASASANIGTFKIGRPNYSGTQAPNFYDGKIDDVRIWNVARSGLDIRTGMVNVVAPNTPGLLSYFKFNETSGTTVINETNNLANGSFVNAVERVDALTYLWSPTGDTVPAITATAPGMYTVSVKDYFGCPAVSNPIFINSVGVNPSGPLTICNGDSVLLDAGVNTNPVYGFSEFFDVSTWTTVHSPNDMGSVNVNAAPNSISILSSNTNAGGGPSSYIDYCHVMNGDGMLNFNWAFSSASSPQTDYPEIILNGTSGSLQNFIYGSGGASNQSGIASIPVLKNQNFCFRMNTTNNQGGAATLTISNIRFPDSYTSYLWSTGATTQKISVSAAGSYTVGVSTSNGCTVVSSPVVVSVNSNPKTNWYVDSDGDGFGNATIDSLYCFQPVGFVANNKDCNDALNYIHPNANENCFNSLDDNCNLIIDEGCGMGDFQLKAMIEGYVYSGGLMIPTLFNNGLNPDPNATDSITVQLRSTSSPYTLIQSNQVVLYRNGFASIPTYPANGSYYIVIKSRNGIETWSKTPVLFEGESVFYDFSK